MKMGMVWSTGRIILKGDNRSTRRNPCPNATPYTKNLTYNSLESNPDLQSKRALTNCVKHGTSLNTKIT